MDGQIIIVTGGRDFSDATFVGAILSQYEIGRLYEGGAKGADTLARRYAISNGILHTTMYANWAKYGNGAGHIRNAAMLKEAIADGLDLVVAFEGGNGTEGMCRLADKAGIPVRRTWLE